MPPSHNTKRIFFISQMLEAPFLALYPMLAIFLVKEYQASPFQISLLTMLKPAITVISFYWSSLFLKKSSSSVKLNLLLAITLSGIAFLFSPWIHSCWYFIAAGAIYALFSKAKVPALMELLKINSSSEEREKLFAKVSSWGYVVAGVTSVCLGPLLDANTGLWPIFFCIASVFLLSSVLVFSSIPEDVEETKELVPSSMKIQEHLLHPWKKTILLLKSRPDFLQFQIGFFIAGFGLMLVMPAIPSFFKELNISYTKLFFSIGILKGLGFILFSNQWATFLQKKSLSVFTSLVFGGFVLFMLFLLLAQYTTQTIFLAYFIYGIAQAGSHLIWHLSGPIFAGQQESYPFSVVNVLSIGVRGFIAPPLGAALSFFIGPTFTIIAGISMGLLATWYMLYNPVLQEQFSYAPERSCT